MKREEVQLTKSDFSRRKMLQAVGATALSASIRGNSGLSFAIGARDIASTAGVPQIAIEIFRASSQAFAASVDDLAIRRVKQLGVNDVLTGGPGLTSFDYDRVKNLPPLAEEGAHNLEEMWSNITYFLQAVVPVAEQAGVRLALHPNDPPAPLSRGSQQIMGSVEGWKRLINIVPSKCNGITFDCGVTREMGHDPVEVCRYFGSRDVINHVHYRNVRVVRTNEKYTEDFIDEGVNDML